MAFTPSFNASLTDKATQAVNKIEAVGNKADITDEVKALKDAVGHVPDRVEVTDSVKQKAKFKK